MKNSIILANTLIQLGLFISVIALGKINKKYTLSMKIVLVLCVFITLIGFKL